MGKYKKPAIRNKKKLVDEISDPEMAYMKRQLEILKADNERLRKERLKNDQNSSKTLALTVASIGKNSKAKHINNHKKSNKEISDSETNISNNQKVYKYNKTRKIINVSENSETDELTYKQVLKKRKHRKNKQANKVTTISSDSETNNEQILLKKYKKKINDNESDIEDMSISQKTKTPIAKPTNLKWYDLPKLLSLDNKVYASYRSAMREFIAEKWNGNTPEYRKISMTKKRYLVEKYKSNNPDFPLSI
ncbi:20403_t:CDS:2, partial [Rhizophagus irregularis]